jgi:hypothetical protein
VDTFLAFPDARRRGLCEQAGQLLGLDAASIEKDFWVCWTLRELFALPDIGTHLTFKGGTSLSKGWKLIERFSEDIDVVIDRSFLGFGGDHSPESAPSNKQRDQRLEDLRAGCQRMIQDALAPSLARWIGEKVSPATWRLEDDPDDGDRQTLLFSYPAALAGRSYVRPVVKIELGARSDTDPSEVPTIQPYIAEAIPGVIEEPAFRVRTVAPERTFWEKASLLHEEGYRAGGKGPPPRFARHYYDLWCLIGAGVADRALADVGLFDRVVAHRRIFFRKSRAAQDSLRPGTLRLLPEPDQRAAWERDYAAMRESMFFGDTPPFGEILRVVGEFEQGFNARVSPAS